MKSEKLINTLLDSKIKLGRLKEGKFTNRGNSWRIFVIIKMDMLNREENGRIDASTIDVKLFS